MDQVKIGKYIQEKRKKLDLTQKELADKLNVSDKSISKWEKGINLPDPSLYNDICNVLNISLIEFISGEDIDEDVKNKKTIDELNNSLIKINKSKKIGEFISLFISCLGLAFEIIISLTCPCTLFGFETLVCFLISMVGFISLMYYSSNNHLLKVIYTILFIILFIVVYFLSTLAYFRFFFNMHYVNYEETNYLYSTNIGYKLNDKCKDIGIDYFIENNLNSSSDIFDKNGNYVSINFDSLLTIYAYVIYDSDNNYVKTTFSYDDVEKYYGEDIANKFLDELNNKKIYESENDNYVIYETSNNYVINFDNVIILNKNEYSKDLALEYAEKLFNSNTISVN